MTIALPSNRRKPRLPLRQRLAAFWDKWRWAVVAAVLMHFAVIAVCLWYKPAKLPYVPPRPTANFNGYEQVTFDTATGEKTTYREFAVSTALHPREPAGASETHD